MAFVKIAVVVALAVAAFAEPLRYRRTVPTNALIAASAAAAAEGAGAANDAHNAAVVAIGIPASSGSGWGSSGSGWGSDSTAGIPASIILSNSGISEVSNDASIIEVTSNDGAGNLAGLQNIDVQQLSGGEDFLTADASGGEVALVSGSDANAQGSGASAATGNVVIQAS